MASEDDHSFCNAFFHAVSAAETTKNFVISPHSIETCLALCFLGAEGETEKELNNALHLIGADKQSVAQCYEQLLTQTKSTNAELKIASRIYVGEQFEIVENFKELASEHFDVTPTKLNFGDAAVGTINAWVEEKTESKIKDLLPPNSLVKETTAVLVNAVYFNASRLENYFTKSSTEKKDFHISKNKKVQVDMMHQCNYFLYGELEDLDVCALEMASVCPDMSMLIILPKTIDGLTDLEAKLRNVDLTEITERLRFKGVKLQLPKFKIEFDISLVPILQRLGLKTMFSKDANFKSLTTSKTPLKINEVKHKAVIEFSDEETKPTHPGICGADFDKIFDFVADHPFLFAIKDKDFVYMLGHVKHF